ncbi:MAG TPA: FAD:protein FMN transferase [Lachnospiraceae bacterium]|nr:FAD:protein FMN transferase [Lachnospiraceae bacterium]
MKILSIAFRALGTLNTIEMPEIPDGTGQELLKKIRDEIMAWDDRLSIFKTGSEISGINEKAGQENVAVSESTFALLMDSVYYGRMTGGLFDITSGPLASLWGIGKKGDFIPSEEDIDEAKDLVDYQDIIFEGPLPMKAGLKRAGQSLDLGGIAKGAAADRAVSMLKEAGVSSAVLDFGGTVSVFGTEKQIGIRNPFDRDGEPVRTITLKDASCVTSGTYERFFYKDGKRYHHILDPKTGYPSEHGIASVTLIGKNAEELDALATSVILLGAGKGMKLAKSRGALGVLIMENGQSFFSEGL